MIKKLLLGVTAALFVTPAAAQGLFDWDDNRDGMLAYNEYYSSVGDFGVYDYDYNNDGLFSESEYNDIGLDWTYDDVDMNGDGFVDGGEFYDTSFSAFDSNSDGNWDENEWSAADDFGLFDL